MGEVRKRHLGSQRNAQNPVSFPEDFETDTPDAAGAQQDGTADSDAGTDEVALDDDFMDACADVIGPLAPEQRKRLVLQILNSKLKTWRLS